MVETKVVLISSRAVYLLHSLKLGSSPEVREGGIVMMRMMVVLLGGGGIPLWGAIGDGVVAVVEDDGDGDDDYDDDDDDYGR